MLGVAYFLLDAIATVVVGGTSLFGGRGGIGNTIVGLFVGALLFSTTALIPSFMQQLMGYSAFQSGLASMPRGLCGTPARPRMIGCCRVKPRCARPEF